VCVRVFYLTTVCKYWPKEYSVNKVGGGGSDPHVNPLLAMVVIHMNAKDQSQRLLGSKVKAETHRRTDGGVCITSHADAVGN